MHCGKGLISVFRQFASTGKIFILAGRLGTGVFEGVPKAGLEVFWCGMLEPVGGSEGLAVAKVVGGIGFGGVWGGLGATARRAFGAGSGLRVGWCAAGGGGVWVLGYYSMCFGHFPDVS